MAADDSLWAPRTRGPMPRIALQPGLVGDANRLIADMQTVAAAIDGAMPERDAWLFDKAGAEKDAIARHTDDVAL